MKRFALSCGVALALAVSAAWAHEAFAEYVWHRVEFGRSGQHLGITVQLTFFEEWSRRERQRMDADADGRIAREERDAYAVAIAASVRPALRLTIGGRVVPLIARYDPDVDLMGSHAVERAHHQLTLRFFTRLPTDVDATAEIQIEDRLWPEAKCHGEVVAADESRSLRELRVIERGDDAAALRFVGRVQESP